MSQVLDKLETVNSRHPYDPDAGSGFGFADTLYDWRRFIILFTLLSVVVTLFAVSVRKHEYEAYVRLMLTPQRIQGVGQDLNPLIQSPDTAIAMVESQMRIMTSDRILGKLIEAENLTDDQEFNGEKRGFFHDLRYLIIGGARSDSARITNVVLNNLKKATSTSRPELSYVVDLSFTSENPNKAAKLANAIAGIYLKSETEKHSQVAQEAADSLIDQLDELLKLLELERDAQVKQAVYEAFLTRAKQLGEQAGLKQNNVTIVSPASPPLEPSGLSSVLFIVVGSGAGFGIACVLAIVFSAAGFSSRRRKPAIAEYSTDNRKTNMFDDMQDNWGLVANNQNQSIEQGSSPSSVLQSSNPQSLESGQNHAVLQQLKLPVLHSIEVSRDCLIGDKIPVLKTNADITKMATIARSVSSLRGNKNSRSVLVTGFEDTLGKSIVAANLAYACIFASENTMLVGADSESMDAVNGFSEIVDMDMIGIGIMQQAAGGEFVETFDGAGFRFLPLNRDGNVNKLRNLAQVERLRDHLGDSRYQTNIAIIDGPLLDDENGIEELVQLADEVIIVLPAGMDSDQFNHGLFSRLGNKRKRIRGIVTLAYT